MQDFLNPKSMATPGPVGATIMVVASALHGNFGVPAAWVALGLSFTTCAFIFSKYVGVRLAKMAIGWKCILYALNSLIVFAIATGAHAPLQDRRSVAEDFERHVSSEVADAKEKIARAKVTKAALLVQEKALESTKGVPASESATAERLARAKALEVEAERRLSDELERITDDALLLRALVADKMATHSFRDPWF